MTIFNRGNNNRSIPSVVKICIGDYFCKDDIIRLSDSYFDVIIDFLARVPSDIERIYPVLGNSCRQFIFISTACVYRRAPMDFPLKENSPKPNRNWNYSIYKYECEEKLRWLNSSFSSYYTIVRPYITYNDERIPIGIAPAYRYHRTIIERIRCGKPMILWDDGKAITTVTHTLDFSKGVVGLFLNDRAKNESFHITSNFQYSGKDLLLELYSVLGQKPNIISVSTEELCELMPQYASMLKGDRTLDAVFDNKKIVETVQHLSFKIDIKEGLRRILTYYDSLGRFEYDYEYDALMDRVALYCGIKTMYVKYPGMHNSQHLIYIIFKYFPYRVAKRLKRMLRWL